MAWATTSISVTTAATLLISTATTWANTIGASQTDTTPFILTNTSTQNIYIGSSLMTTVSLGMPVLTNEKWTFDLWQSDPLFAISTGAAVTVNVMAGRQNG